MNSPVHAFVFSAPYKAERTPVSARIPAALTAKASLELGHTLQIKPSTDSFPLYILSQHLPRLHEPRIRVRLFESALILILFDSVSGFGTKFQGDAIH